MTINTTFNRWTAYSRAKDAVALAYEQGRAGLALSGDAYRAAVVVDISVESSSRRCGRGLTGLMGDKSNYIRDEYKRGIIGVCH